MPLPTIDPKALQIFVFGPGTGELVVVRSPPDDWMVLDGCSARSAGYGRLLLEHYQAQPTLIVLSHPHLDHARGLADVIDRATRGRPQADWPVIGMVAPSQTTGSGDLRDLGAHYDGGIAEEAVSAILTCWETAPQCRSDLPQGLTLQLGASKLTVVGPSPAARNQAWARVKAGQAFNPNTIATALLLEWQGQRVLLGSDLVEAPGGGWTEAVGALSGGWPASAVVKVPHHGSAAAIHHAAVVPAGAATPPELVVTPFAPQRLPKPNAGGGLAVLLSHAPHVHLTALPVAYAEQGVSPDRVSLGALASAPRGLGRSPPTPGFPDCFVAVELRPGAGPPVVSHGPGSLVVTP